MSSALVIALKALHISALVFWCAGLIALPVMLLHGPETTDATWARSARKSNRAAFVFIASPAGFVAIGTGIGLIFAVGVFEDWLFLKLGVVGVLVIAHLQIGRVVMRVSRDHDWHPPTWRLAPILGASLGAVLVILWLVLAKPPIATQVLPWWLLQPVGVQPSLTAPPPLTSSSSSSSVSSSATMTPI